MSAVRVHAGFGVQYIWPFRKTACLSLIPFFIEINVENVLKMWSYNVSIVTISQFCITLFTPDILCYHVWVGN